MNLKDLLNQRNALAEEFINKMNAWLTEFNRVTDNMIEQGKKVEGFMNGVECEHMNVSEGVCDNCLEVV